MATTQSALKARHADQESLRDVFDRILGYCRRNPSLVVGLVLFLGLFLSSAIGSFFVDLEEARPISVAPLQPPSWELPFGSDKQGRNLFAGTPQAPADALRHAVGGLQASARDNLLLFAPHANSYRRFVANAFVPLNDSWGFNNRTVAMRIPHSDPANTRIEHRIAGADANPYLVAAAVLAGMLDGIERQLDPGAPVTGNAYEQFPLRTPHWRQAIDDFLGSAFAARWYGESFRHIYGEQKRKEMLDFHAQVPDLDYAWYLRTV